MNIKFLTKALILVGLVSTLSFANMETKDENTMMKKSGNKPTTMSCGAGKCGSGMMKPNKKMDEEEGSMMKKSGNKPTTMSCGAGKCGSGMSK